MSSFAPFFHDGYQQLLGVAPSAAETSAIKQDLLDRLARLAPGDVVAYDLAAKAVRTVAAAGPDFINGINAAYEAAAGRPASVVELAAARSEFGAGLGYSSSTVTAATLRTQIAELSGGAPPQTAGYAFDWPDIDPQTVSGRPDLICGLPNNVVLIAAQEKRSATYSTGPATHGSLPSIPQPTSCKSQSSKQRTSVSLRSATPTIGGIGATPHSTSTCLAG